MFKKLLVALAVSFLFVGIVANNVQANGWGHHGGGWGHHGGWGGGWGGHRGWGVYRPNHWGGWGGGYRHWGGYRNFGYAAYRPWGGYRRFYNYGGYGGFWPSYASYYYPSYSYPVYSYPTYYSYPYSGCYGATTVNYNDGFVGDNWSVPVTNILFADAQPQTRAKLSNLETAITRAVRNLADGSRVARVEPAVRGGVATTTIYPASTTESLAVREARKTLATRDPSRLIVTGDDAFRAGRYREALRSYDNAVDHAPKPAEAYFRQGHALVALGRYDEATLAFRRALDVGGDAARGGFRLKELYGSKADETAHIEALAAHVLEGKNRAGDYFLLGMTLQYSGEVAQAKTFFRKAAELSTDPGYLATFLPDAVKAPPVVVSARVDEI